MPVDVDPERVLRAVPEVPVREVPLFDDLRVLTFSSSDVLRDVPDLLLEPEVVLFEADLGEADRPEALLVLDFFVAILIRD